MWLLWSPLKYSEKEQSSVEDEYRWLSISIIFHIQNYQLLKDVKLCAAIVNNTFAIHSWNSVQYQLTDCLSGLYKTLKWLVSLYVCMVMVCWWAQKRAKQSFPPLKLSYSVLILNYIFSKWHYFILFLARPARSPFALFERTTSTHSLFWC